MVSRFLLLLLVPGSIATVAGMLNFSTPAFTIPYNGYHIRIFGSSDSGYTYAPNAILLPWTSKIVPNNSSGFSHVAIEMQLWDNHYIQHIKSFIFQEIGRNVSVRPMSFTTIRLSHSVEHDTGKGIVSQWQSIVTYPERISLRIRCITVNHCQHTNEIFHAGRAEFGLNVHLLFSYQIGNYKKVKVSIDNSHLLDSPVFSAVVEHFHNTNLVYMESDDYFRMVYEVLINALDAALETDEFVGEEQLSHLMQKILPVFRSSNVTSSGEFTDEMWAATYWADETERPDRKLKNLHALFENGVNWLQRAMQGDTAVGEVPSFEKTPVILSALAELKSGKGVVQWDGKQLIAKPRKLYCLDLEKLRRREHFRHLIVRVSKSQADYWTEAVTARGSGETNATKTPTESSLDTFINDRLEKLENAVRNNTLNISQLESKIGGNSGQIDSLSTAVTSIIPTRLETLERSTSNQSKAFSQLKDALNVTTSAVSTVHQRFFTLESIVNSSLIRNVTLLYDDLKSLKVAVAPFASAITRLETVEGTIHNSVMNAITLLDVKVNNINASVLPVGSVVALPVGISLPYCWLLCNGQSFSSTSYPQLAQRLGVIQVPDLKGKFLLGDSSQFPVGSTGGEAQHMLTLEEMPSHNHDARDGGKFVTYDEPSHGVLNHFLTSSTANTRQRKDSQVATTGKTGGNAPHNNMPPYRSTKFIIRAC